MFSGRPFGHVSANLGEYRLSQRSTQARYRDQIDARDTTQVGAGRRQGGIFTFDGMLGRWERWRVSGWPGWLNGREVLLDFGIASSDLLGVR